MINTAQKVILIVCDAVGRTFAHTLNSGLAPLNNIIGMINYCMKIEIAEEYFKSINLLEKVHITNEAKILQSKCIELKDKAFEID